MLNTHQTCIIAMRHHFILCGKNAIPEVIIGFYKSFSSPLDHLSLSDLGV